MEICKLNLRSTSVNLEGIYYTFQIRLGLTLVGSSTASFFSARIILFKKWLYSFQMIFVVRNTFDINIINIFFFDLVE